MITSIDVANIRSFPPSFQIPVSDEIFVELPHRCVVMRKNAEVVATAHDVLHTKERGTYFLLYSSTEMLRLEWSANSVKMTKTVNTFN